MSKDNFIEVTGVVKRETEKAMLVDLGDEEVWFPISILGSPIVRDTTNNEIKILVPFWFAKKIGLET
jgi:hypothetical protein